MVRVLCVITTAFVPYGGLATVALNYYRHIDRNLFHMDFASTNAVCDSLRHELDDRGSKYYQLPGRAKNPIAYMKELRRILRNYDIVHIHANSATAVTELTSAWLAGVKKRILHIHNSTTGHPIIHRLLHPLMKRLTTVSIACSQRAGSWIFDSFTVLNNAIDTERYKYSEECRKKVRGLYGIEEGTFVIGNVGKFGKQKNHEFMLDVFSEALKYRNDCKLMLIGDGKLRKDIEMKAEIIGVKDKIVMCGMQDDAAPFYSAMDVFLFPSLWEGMPLSLLEAQANGLPCMASDVITPEANISGGGGTATFFIGKCLCMG